VTVSRSPGRRRIGVALGLAASVVSAACTFETPERVTMSLDQQLEPTEHVPARDGLAAAILIDVSGSMEQRVAGDGGRERKIEIARRAVRDLVGEFDRYATDHPAEPVMLGIYEFSRRDDKPDVRPLLPMSTLARGISIGDLSKVVAEGGTPIGTAMIAAKHELDATGLSRRHLLVVTDGENTDGIAPDQVTAAIGRRPESERPSIYLVAFDIDARQFNSVRDAGALLLAAGNAKELSATLDGLLRGKILVEQ
jgi:Mg-chelatase subunit ChlD